MIELLSALAESDAYPLDRALPGSPRQCSLPFACRHTSRKAPNWSSEEACTWEHHPQLTIQPPRLNRAAKSLRQPTGCISRGRARPYTRRKDPSTLERRNQVSEGEKNFCIRSLPKFGKGAVCMHVCMYVFIKLHITTQSGPVILVILCHCMYVCIYLYMYSMYICMFVFMYMYMYVCMYV